MPDKPIFTTTVGASVRQTVTSLESELTSRSAQALRMSGEEFRQSADRHNTPNGFRRAYEQTGNVNGAELFARIVIDYDGRKDSATVTTVETSPLGTVTTTAELRPAPRGKTTVSVKGDVSAEVSAAYKSYLGQVFRSVDARTGQGVA